MRMETLSDKETDYVIRVVGLPETQIGQQLKLANGLFGINFVDKSIPGGCRAGVVRSINNVKNFTILVPTLIRNERCSILLR